MRKPTTVSILALVAFSTIAHAGVMQLVQDERRTISYLEGWSEQDIQHLQELELFPPTPFADWDTENKLTIPFLQTHFTQSSTISENQFSVDYAGSSSMEPDAPSFYAFSNFAHAISVSTFSVEFELDETVTFEIDMLLTSFGSVHSESTLTVTDTQSDLDLHVWEASQGSLQIQEQIVLGPGSYSFSVYADTGVSLQNPDTLLSNSGYVGTFTAIPTPSSLALLTLSGLLTTRRRR